MTYCGPSHTGCKDGTEMIKHQVRNEKHWEHQGRSRAVKESHYVDSRVQLKSKE